MAMRYGYAVCGSYYMYVDTDYCMYAHLKQTSDDARAREADDTTWQGRELYLSSGLGPSVGPPTDRPQTARLGPWAVPGACLL